MGGTAPLLPPRPCWGPQFLFSLVLTRLMVPFRKRGRRGVKENGGAPGPGALAEGGASPPQLGDLELTTHLL